MGAALALAATCCLNTSPTLAQSTDSVKVPERRAAAGGALLPASWKTRLDYASTAVSVEIALSEIGEAQAARELADGSPGIPVQIGFPREVPDVHRGNVAENADWTRLPDGGQVASFTIRSPGAKEVRAALQATLPPGSKLRFFGGEGSQAYPLYIAQDLQERGADSLTGDADNGVLWSPIMDGDEVGVEIEIPASAQPADVALNFVRMSHIPSSRIRMKSSTTTADEECPLLDAVCNADFPECQRAAVAKVIYTKGDGRSFVCSGTALNTHRPEAENFSDPYFLTAHHCIDAQSTADSMETDWHYEHDACNGTVIDSKRRTLRRGGILLATDPDSDMSLVKLRDPIPSGVCLSGWSVNIAGLQSVGADVASIHHPGGRPKKYSLGQVEGYSVVPIGEDLWVDSLVVNWSDGRTLGGSSGGGLFAFDDDHHRLIGVLSGGPEEACSTRTKAFYGRLDTFWVNHAQPYLREDEPTEDDHGGSQSTATGVVLGSSVAGNVESRADRDVFRVEVTEPGVLRLFTTGATNTVGRLYGDGHELVRIDSDGGYLRNFMVLAFVTEGT